ncbi:hypothetical protein K469DRAFT_686619 [Zopfia rhizophila CBS 207.26]|uniref:MYND-type domain-containing protein n=1 Tax=Zopfia rhizophila CBS 207.26 TaxID=1314779 RepID=A0A6A6EWW9_9PEZI|nr:hypothetical protein K469DRAFT_686619 [Zopfia rhizophila CBS 207.26]
METWLKDHLELHLDLPRARLIQRVQIVVFRIVIARDWPRETALGFTSTADYSSPAPSLHFPCTKQSLWSPPTSPLNSLSSCRSTQNEFQTLHCTRLKNGEFFQRFYCDSRCQEMDWPTHKAKCLELKQRKHVQESALRAGELAQHIFNMYVKETWTYDMSAMHVSRPNGKLTGVEVIAGKAFHVGVEGESSCLRKGGNWLVQFPHFDGKDTGVECALLADDKSIWAFVVMHAVVRKLFEGIVQNIDIDVKEIIHKRKPGLSHIVHYKNPERTHKVLRRDHFYKDGNDHGVYEITLRTGDKVALNLTSAQYGIIPMEPVMFWTDYWTKYGHQMLQRNNYQFAWKTHCKLLIEIDNISILTVHSEAVTALGLAMVNFEHDYERASIVVDESNPPIYSEKKALLLKNVHEGLQEYITTIITGGPIIAGPHPSYDASFGKVQEEVKKLNTSYLGGIKKVDWKVIERVVTGKRSTIEQKRRAKALLDCRYAYQPANDWRIVFLRETLPPKDIPAERISENPMWKSRW